MYHRIRDRTKAVRRLAELGHIFPSNDAVFDIRAKAEIRVQELKLEAQRINAENAQRMAEAKAERIAATVAASATKEMNKFHALKKWIRENHPSLWEDACEAMNAAE
jgi:glycerol-3-phosphate O-acyltransferase